jgi:hypothetical protein
MALEDLGSHDWKDESSGATLQCAFFPKATTLKPTALSCAGPSPPGRGRGGGGGIRYQGSGSYKHEEDSGSPRRSIICKGPDTRMVLYRFSSRQQCCCHKHASHKMGSPCMGRHQEVHTGLPRHAASQCSTPGRTHRPAPTRCQSVQYTSVVHTGLPPTCCQSVQYTVWYMQPCLKSKRSTHQSQQATADEGEPAVPGGPGRPEACRHLIA